jgi:hypothetical protein
VVWMSLGLWLGYTQSKRSESVTPDLKL